jgi:hypothetical protein
MDWCGNPGCLPVPCANIAVCGRSVSRSQLDTRSGRCLHCSFTLGHTLRFLPPGVAECSICLQDETAHVALPGCSHGVCVECARTLLAGPQPRCPLCRAGATVAAGAGPVTPYRGD